MPQLGIRKALEILRLVLAMRERRTIWRRARADIDDARACGNLRGLRRNPAIAVAQIEPKEVGVASRLSAARRVVIS